LIVTIGVFSFSNWIRIRFRKHKIHLSVPLTDNKPLDSHAGKISLFLDVYKTGVQNPERAIGKGQRRNLGKNEASHLDFQKI